MGWIQGYLRGDCENVPRLSRLLLRRRLERRELFPEIGNLQNQWVAKVARDMRLWRKMIRLTRR